MVDKITIGAEIEFSCRDIQNLCEEAGLFNELDLEREYYSFQVEYNNILLECDLTLKEIEKTLIAIKKIIEKVAFKIEKAIDKDLYLSHYSYQTNGGVVFNGLHLHLDVSGAVARLSLRELNRIIRFAVSQKAHYLSPRFLLSHHIWGAFRYSDYDFKRKSRFRPVSFSNLNTLEFRLFDLEDLYFFHSRKMVAETLFAVAVAIENDAVLSLPVKTGLFEFLAFDFNCEILSVPDMDFGRIISFISNPVFFTHRIVKRVDKIRKHKILR